MKYFTVDLRSQSITVNYRVMAFDFPEPMIRNYPNQVFNFHSDYDAVKRALLKEDLRFLREEFNGQLTRACFMLQNYVYAFQERETAQERLYDYMDSIGDTGTSYWDHATNTVISPILTEDQKNIKEPLLAALRKCEMDQRNTRTDLLYLMYGYRRDEDDDDDIYGCGVDEDE